MVRKREPKKATAPKSSKKRESRFIEAINQPAGLDPRAPRKFKSLTLQMNEYEYERLKQAADAADRGMLDYVRQALKKATLVDLGE